MCRRAAPPGAVLAILVNQITAFEQRMTAVNFSAHGTRWRALPVTTDTLNTVPVVPGPGLLFTSAEGEIRFLALDSGAVPALAELQATSNVELGNLVQSAKPLSR